MNPSSNSTPPIRVRVPFAIKLSMASTMAGDVHQEGLLMEEDDEDEEDEEEGDDGGDAEFPALPDSAAGLEDREKSLRTALVVWSFPRCCTPRHTRIRICTCGSAVRMCLNDARTGQSRAVTVCCDSQRGTPYE